MSNHQRLHRASSQDNHTANKPQPQPQPQMDPLDEYMDLGQDPYQDNSFASSSAPRRSAYGVNFPTTPLANDSLSSLNTPYLSSGQSNHTRDTAITTLSPYDLSDDDYQQTLYHPSPSMNTHQNMSGTSYHATRQDGHGSSAIIDDDIQLAGYRPVVYPLGLPRDPPHARRSTLVGIGAYFEETLGYQNHTQNQRMNSGQAVYGSPGADSDEAMSVSTSFTSSSILVHPRSPEMSYRGLHSRDQDTNSPNPENKSNDFVDLDDATPRRDRHGGMERDKIRYTSAYVNEQQGTSGPGPRFVNADDQGCRDQYQRHQDQLSTSQFPSTNIPRHRRNSRSTERLNLFHSSIPRTGGSFGDNVASSSYHVPFRPHLPSMARQGEDDMDIASWLPDNDEWHRQY